MRNRRNEEKMNWERNRKYEEEETEHIASKMNESFLPNV